MEKQWGVTCDHKLRVAWLIPNFRIVKSTEQRSKRGKLNFYQAVNVYEAVISSFSVGDCLIKVWLRQELVNEVFFWEEALLSPKMISIWAESHFFEQAYQKNYCSSLKTQYICLGRMSVSESPHEKFCPSHRMNIPF